MILPGEVDRSSSGPEASVKIRAMHEEETVAVSELLVVCYRWLADREGYTREQVEFLVHQRGSVETVTRESREQLYLVACVDGGVAGMASVADNQVTKLYVDPARHGQGIGSRLLAAAEVTIRQAGHDRMLLGTTQGTVPFYESRGMTVAGRRRPRAGPFTDRDVVQMEKSLGGSAEGRPAPATPVAGDVC